MIEWKERLINAYGKLSGGGFQLAAYANARYYSELNDRKILELKSQYGIQFAVVQAEQNTEFKKVFCTVAYCILDLSSFSTASR